MPGGWIEIDLGRDRLIGGIDLHVVGNSIPNRFDVRFVSTGQRTSEGRIWFRELAAQSRLGDPGGTSVVSIRSRASRARNIRLEFPEGGKVQLAMVRVLPPVTETEPGGSP